MNSYKKIAEEAGVSVEEVRGLMARAYVKKVEIPYYRTTEDGYEVDAVEEYYAVCARRCRPFVLGIGDTIAEAVADALTH